MALESLIINKNSNARFKLFAYASVVAIILVILSLCIVGWQYGTKGVFEGKIIGGTIVFCLCAIGLIFGYGYLVLAGILNLILTEVLKVGLKPESFNGTNKGMREFERFEQMFNLILSVLKRVLLISLKLEVASSDLDKTAQTSSLVIKEIVDGVGGINQKAIDNATNLRETISSLENSFSLALDGTNFVMLYNFTPFFCFLRL